MTAAEVETIRRELSEFQTTMLGRFDVVDARLAEVDASLGKGNGRFADHEQRITAIESRDVLDELFDRLWKRLTDRRTLLKIGTFLATVVGLVNGLIVLIGRVW